MDVVVVVLLPTNPAKRREQDHKMEAEHLAVAVGKVMTRMMTTHPLKINEGVGIHHFRQRRRRKKGVKIRKMQRHFPHRTLFM